jgi:hypothetical protein
VTPLPRRVWISGSDPSAQLIGTFSGQLQPYCNVVTLNTTQTGNVYTLEGYDDQCGATTRAATTGLTFQNPDGTIWVRVGNREVGR